jgi:hypothetical protein
MKVESDTITIECTGRTLHANSGIIGISPNRGTYTGYDDNLAAEEWSPAERIELCDHMIKRWQAFRDEAVAAITLNTP